MAEFGQVLGDAVDFQADARINDLYRQQEGLARKKSQLEAEAKMFADDTRYQNAMNPFDHKRVKEYAQSKIYELGEWQRQNPNWKIDPTLRAEYQNRVDDIKSNEYSINGMASDSNYKAYVNDLQEVSKNPQFHDVGAYDEIGKQWQNYQQYGNQNGLEAAQKEGYKPFVYMKPKDFVDLNEVYRKTGSSIQAKGLEYLNNGRDGAFKTFAEQKDLQAEAEAIYAQNKRQLDLEYTAKGINPVEEVMKKLDGYVPIKFDIGDKNRLGEEMALAKYKHSLDQALANPNVSPYKVTILDTGYARPPAEKLAETFGSTPRHTLPAGKDGVPIDNTGDTFYYDGDIFDKGYREDGKYQKTGVKTATGFAKKPLSFGVEAGYLYDPTGSSGDPALKNTDYSGYEIRPEYKKFVSFIDSPIDKKGNTTKVLKVKSRVDINANEPSYLAEWDKSILTTKQRDGIGVSQNPLGTGSGAKNPQGAPLGSIVTNKKTGTKYRAVEGGWEVIR